MSRQTGVITLVSIVCLVALGAGCGSFRHASSGAVQVVPAVTDSNISGQLDALATPPGVDPLVMAQLKRELLKQLGEGGARTASQVATTEENRVTTLKQTRSGGIVTLTWMEKAVGDYNQDGRVAVDDLVPVGQYWMRTSLDPNWPNAQLADGDGNGIINVSDVTPIGRNFGNQILLYDIFTNSTIDYPSSSWTGSAGHDTAVRIGAQRQYTMDFLAVNVGSCFFVAPSDGTQDGIESLPSNLWGSENWAHLANFSQSDWAADIACDIRSGAFYIGGKRFNDFNSTDDLCLVKYDAQGKYQWARSWGTNDAESTYGIAVDLEGNIYQVGCSNGLHSGVRDCLLVKWDQNGNLAWAQGWGGSGATQALGTGVAVDAAGWAYVNAQLDDGSESLMTLLRYTPEGSLYYAVTWGSGSKDSPTGIAVDESGVYCSGITERGTTPSNPALVMVHYGFDLTRKWGKIFYPSSTCYAQSLALDANCVYLGAQAHDTPSAGLALVLCLDKNGVEQWNKYIGGVNNNLFHDIAADGAGNVFICGLTDSLNYPLCAGLLAKFDSSGTVPWTALWNGPDNVEFTGLVFDQAGMLALAGTTRRLSRSWVIVGMQSGQFTFSPTDIIGADIPVSGTETDATLAAIPEELTGTIDVDPSDTSYLITSYKPY